MPDPTVVFILSYGRPLYLWTCLDALYRHTRTPARFILIDNWHPDRQVDAVIRAFERRGLFHEVLRSATNRVENIETAVAANLPQAGGEIVYIEGDVCILPGEGCWLGEMLRIFRSEPQIGMLGSLIDTSDFVSESTCRALARPDTDVSFLAKLKSDERGFAEDPSRWADDRDFFYTEPPCPLSNPPGRLLILDSAILAKVGVRQDFQLAQAFRLHGRRPAITAKVRHRHLSLLNIFDYETYSRSQRDGFFQTMRVLPETPGSPVDEVSQ